MRAWIAAFSLISCGGHGGHDHGNLPPAPEMIVPEPWRGDPSLAELTDENPDPAIVEVTLRAAPARIEYLPGAPADVWAYGGSVPGPLLRARVGDRVIVHFRNDLPEETTIHWHGVRVPAAMDGSIHTMDPIPAGGTFDYDFVVLDAGTYWYHPHIRSDRQVEKGLYGAILVEDDAPALPIESERIVVLDDVLLDPDSGALDESTDARIEHLGREGNLVLVNGARSNVEIEVAPGAWHRFRLINAANGRFFRLLLAGGTMARVGGDGGWLTAPERPGELLLVPGERADLLFAIDRDATAVLRAAAYERARGLGATETVDVLRLVASADPPIATPELPASLREIAPLGAPVETREIRLGERMIDGRMEFLIDGAAYPDVPTISASLDTVEDWIVVNETHMDHPFHLHGFFFQPDGRLEWKDTIDVPAETTLTLRVDFASRPGAAGHWMYHCHILEHAERGMMAVVHVE